MQETHISIKDQRLLKRGKLGEKIYSLISKKTRGTVIYPKKD